MEKRFQRPLSITERIWLSVNALCPPYVNQLVSAGRGTLDLKDLQHAVEKASQANPGSRLILKGSLHKAYWLDSGVTPPVRLISGRGWDGYDREAAPYLQTPLPYSGPTCEVVFVPGDISHVIVRSNHGVMDAGGTVSWADDIYRVLRGEEPLGSSSTMTEAALTRQFSSATKKMSTLKCIAPTGKAQPGPKGITWETPLLFRQALKGNGQGRYRPGALGVEIRHGYVSDGNSRGLTNSATGCAFDGQFIDGYLRHRHTGFHTRINHR